MRYERKCPVCGKETDELPQACEDCDTNNGFICQYKDDYTITLYAPDAVYPTAPASFFARNFHPFTDIPVQVRNILIDFSGILQPCEEPVPQPFDP